MINTLFSKYEIRKIKEHVAKQKLIDKDNKYKIDNLNSFNHVFKAIERRNKEK